MIKILELHNRMCSKIGKIEAKRSRKPSFEQGKVCLSYMSCGKTS